MQFCEVSALYFHWESIPIGMPAHICVVYTGHLLANTMCPYQVYLVASTSTKTSVILQAMPPQSAVAFQRPSDPQSGLHSLALVQSMSQHRQDPVASAALHSKAMVKLTMPATSLVFGEPPQTYTPMFALFGIYKMSASFLDQGADFAKCTCLRDLGTLARMWIKEAYLDSVNLSAWDKYYGHKRLGEMIVSIESGSVFFSPVKYRLAYTLDIMPWNHISYQRICLKNLYSAE